MSFFALLKIYLKYSWKYKFLFIIFNIGIIVSNVIPNIYPLFIKSFIDLIQQNRISELAGIVVFILLLFLVSSSADMLLFSSRNRLFYKIAENLKTDAVINLQNQDYAYHTSKSSGKLVSLINKSENGLSMFQDFLNMRVFSDLLAMITPCVVITALSWKVGLVFIIFPIVFSPFIWLVSYKNLKMRKAANVLEGNLNGIITDNLIGFETVKAFSKEKNERERLRNSFLSFTKLKIRSTDMLRLLDVVIYICSVLIILGALFISIHEFQNNHLPLSSLLVIVAYVFSYPVTLRGLVYSVREIFRGIADFESFSELLFLKPGITDKTEVQIIENPTGKIELNNISFSYNKSETIKNISLSIKPEENIAFVGPSGAGKSTIVKLLLRYYDITDGEILMDGINIKDLAQTNLRNLIGIVPQDPVMFNNTIFYNVSYALENATQNEVENVCKLAQIHEFIETLPEKYQTVIGERGIKLSGGQRQRLAIARMILKNPKIVVFDEATSALDSESEKLIQKAFYELSSDKTTIIIAHRLSTIIHCDRIFVVDQGQIVQEGNHEQLVNEEGLYKKLWNIQAGGFVKKD